METAVKTNIVIVTYNALPYTKATISSLHASTNSPYHLTIVDNASTDGTVEYLEALKNPKACEGYTLIKNNTNTGVGHAYNQGQQISFKNALEYTAFCNNDLFFSRGWLSRLEANLDANGNVAMLSPLRPSAKVAYDDKTSSRDRLLLLPETDDWQSELIQYTGLPLGAFDKFCNRILEINNKNMLEIIGFPDSLSTCICLTRNKSFKSLGYFADPLFKEYGGEDIDTCWRMMSVGFDCAVDHSVYVHHFRGKSLKANKLKRHELLRKSNRLLYDRWRDSIHSHIRVKQAEGIDANSLIQEGANSQYWLLHELNKDISFMDEYTHA